jgi:hypothetical protein
VSGVAKFGDRYFPAAHSDLPVELPTAKEHARLLVGSYFNSTSSFSNFIDVANFLGQAKIGLDEDGRPSIPSPALSPDKNAGGIVELR